MLSNYSLVVIICLIILLLILVIISVVRKPHRQIQYKKYYQIQKMEEPSFVLGGFSEPNHTYNMFITPYIEPPGPKFSNWA